MNKVFAKFDGRHKIAVIASLVCWGISIFFSQQGFAIDASKSAWLGWILGGIVTVVELVFNSPTQRLSLTLIGAGILCYVYGVWTNVTGFWEYQNPGVVFPIWSQASMMSWFVGVMIEVLPEPLFMWGVGSAFGGDLVGNLVGLWKGDLSYAKPDENHKEPVQQFNQHSQQQRPINQDILNQLRNNQESYRK